MDTYICRLLASCPMVSLKCGEPVGQRIRPIQLKSGSGSYIGRTTAGIAGRKSTLATGGVDESGFAAVNSYGADSQVVTT